MINYFNTYYNQLGSQSIMVKSTSAIFTMVNCPTRLKTHRLFQVDIDRREQCCAANCEQVVNHVVPVEQCCNNMLTILFIVGRTTLFMPVDINLEQVVDFLNFYACNRNQGRNRTCMLREWMAIYKMFQSVFQKKPVVKTPRYLSVYR